MKFKVWPIVLLVLLTLPAILPLLTIGFPSTHDGITHVVRFVRFHQALTDGQVIPRWADGVAFGLGSPVLMYNAYLPYLSAEIPRLLGASWASSIEIVFAASFILSAVTFYLWSAEIFGKTAGFVGALFYVWVPYRFVDIYVRGEYPESFAFIFPPLLLLAAKKIVEKADFKWILLAALSMSGLILSHTLMALLFAVVYVIYGFLLVLLSKDFKKIKYLALGFSVSLLLTAFFWVPAFFEKGEVNLDRLNFTASYLTNFVSLDKIIYSRWGWGPLSSDSPMSLQLGLAQQLAVVLAIIFGLVVVGNKTDLGKVGVRILSAVRIKLFLSVGKVEWAHLFLFLTLLLASVFLITPYSIWLWENISLLGYFLYPWRFLALATFSMAILASFLIYILKNNRVLILLLILLLFYGNKNHLKLVGTAPGEDHFYQTYNDTTDMWGEFLPVNTNLGIINKCKTEKCSFPKVVVPNEVLVSDVEQNSLQTAFVYTSQKDFPATINTLYFPGWQTYLDGSLKDFSINSLGTMDINLPSGKHRIEMRFESTPLRSVTAYVSLLSAIALALYIWKKNG